MSTNNNRFTVTSGISSSGIKYLNLEAPGISFAIRVSEVGAGRNGLDQALADRQIVITPAQRVSIISQASAIEYYPPMPYAERGGWVDASNYIRRSGQITSARGSLTATTIAFTLEPRGTSSKGNLTEWRANIAVPMTGQTLLQFLVLTSFAGPVLSLSPRIHNILFEIVGPGGEGKSSALHLAASTNGPSVDRGNGTYWFTPSGTTNWLENRMVAHADATAMLDEFQLFGADVTPAARSQIVHDFVMRHSEGSTRGRMPEACTIRYRGVGILTANQLVRDLMLSRHGVALNPTTSRLISQPGNVGFGLGTLDFLPDGYSNARSFVSSLLRATEDYHGTAMPAFLTGLVELRSKNEEALRTKIAEHIDFFVARAVGGVGGFHSRVAEAYGVIYVAGRLARHFEVVPDDWDPLEIALECYRRYMASLQDAEAKPIADLLRGYANRTDIVDLDQGLPALSDDQLADASGFSQRKGSGRELIIPPNAITRLIAEWPRRKADADVARHLVRDGTHLTRKRVVRRGGRKERMYVFNKFD